MDNLKDILPLHFLNSKILSMACTQSRCFSRCYQILEPHLWYL